MRKVDTFAPHNDGHQWRKYGEKKINNTNFPRSGPDFTCFVSFLGCFRYFTGGEWKFCICACSEKSILARRQRIRLY